MIYDRIANANLYKGISFNLDTALDFLMKHNKNLSLGRNEIDDERVFVNIISAKTKSREGAEFEYHKKYLDIHFILEGEEKFLVSYFNKLNTVLEYNAEKDYALQTGKAQVELIMTSENFCICFPNDAHLPLVINNEPEDIKKGIIKVLL